MAEYTRMPHPSNLAIDAERRLKIKHWIAVHTWNSEADKLEFEKEIAPSLLESEEKRAEIVSELKGADLQQTWVGDGAFFFFHWQAESNQHVLDTLAANDLIAFFIKRFMKSGGYVLVPPETNRYRLPIEKHRGGKRGHRTAFN